jgi:hypothetical protein
MTEMAGRLRNALNDTSIKRFFTVDPRKICKVFIIFQRITIRRWTLECISLM